MVKVYAARTLPVNPSTTTFILKRKPLWESLQRKVRNAPEFVPAMKSCKVVTDKDNVVVRDCELQLPNGSMRNMREEVTSHGDQWIIFRQTDGSTTTNLLSNGLDKNDHDLQLTYFFEWNYPDATEGSKEHEEAIQMTDKMAFGAVKESIETARRLVQSGAVQNGS